MKYLATTFFILITNALWCNLLAQTDTTSISLGKRVTIFSKVLNEKREIWIATPGYYDGSGDTYPVLYLLDGESHFKHISAMVEYLSYNLRIPELIVVGINNTDRIRDMTPLHSLEGLNGKEDKALFSTTGGGDKFAKCIAEEIIPYINKNYRTQPYRIIEGHSLAGMFAFHAFQKYPELFQAEIIISPAFYGANSATLKLLPSYLKSDRSIRSRLYLAIGDEPRLMRRYDSLILMLKKFSPPTLLWASKKFPLDDHGSVVHPAMEEGLRFIYPHWWINTSDPNHSLTYKELKDHFVKLSGEYGYVIPPSELAVATLGFYYMELKKLDEAVAVFQEGIKQFPTSANLLFYHGMALKEKGEKALAVKSLEKSLELKPDNEGVRGLLKELKDSGK